MRLLHLFCPRTSGWCARCQRPRSVRIRPRRCRAKQARRNALGRHRPRGCAHAALASSKRRWTSCCRTPARTALVPAHRTGAAQGSPRSRLAPAGRRRAPGRAERRPHLLAAASARPRSDPACRRRPAGAPSPGGPALQSARRKHRAAPRRARTRSATPSAASRRVLRVMSRKAGWRSRSVPHLAHDLSGLSVTICSQCLLNSSPATFASFCLRRSPRVVPPHWSAPARSARARLLQSRHRPPHRR